MAGYERNVAGQSLVVFAFDVVTGLGKTGDANNITLFRSIDEGTVTQVTGPPTEVDSTNAPGYYRFTLVQADTNGQYVDFFSKSSTTSPNNVGVTIQPPAFTVPANFSTTAMRGTDNALLAASAPTNFGDLAVTATTGQVTVGTNNDKAGYSISGTLTTLDDLNVPTAATIADAVYDEAKSGHATAGTFGEALSALPTATAGTPGGLSLYDNLFFGMVAGTVSDADAAAGDFDGNAGLSATDNFYRGSWVLFTSGTLAGIARKVSAYTGSSKNFTFTGTANQDADAPFPANPSQGDQYVILAFHGA